MISQDSRFAQQSDPLLLLCEAILRQEIDLLEISISSVIEEYLRQLEGASRTDLVAVSGKFLSYAALLLCLKSGKLLSHGQEALPEEEEEPVFIVGDHKLVFQKAALRLRALIDSNPYRSRQPDIPAGLFDRPAGARIRGDELSPQVLASVFVGLISSRLTVGKPKDGMFLLDSKILHARLEEEIKRVLSHLSLSCGYVSFSELIRDRKSKLEVILTFLALLELFKQGVVELRQADVFGEIVARVGHASSCELDSSGGQALA